jgi:excisionase family DNA binding protein
MSADERAAASFTLTLPDKLLDAFAERIVEHLHTRTASITATDSPWLDFDAALAYLGFTRDKLYKLTAARAIPSRKKRGGQGLLFHRDELDRWLEAQYPQEGWPARIELSSTTSP